MNYLPVDNPGILEDLTRRKEFYQFFTPAEHAVKKTDNWVQKYNLKDLKEEDVHLEPASYQIMVSNFINPFTPYSRLLLKWLPGTGKTIAAINIAMQFIKLFERESQMEDPQIGSVFVIGFTEEIFKRELLSFPKFGFINRDELKQLQTLKEHAHNENKNDVDRLQEFMTKLKKRLGSRKENGYFKFFGYKAFVNRIFMLQDFKRNINDMSEDEIRQSLKDGSLKWNKPLLDSFKNSLVICDEIHNVYNSLEKNNWGVALQMVLDHDVTTKATFMSATPINNSPTEVIDLANFMQPPGSKLVKEDYFEGKVPKKGALDKISIIFRGRVSFIQDTDPRHFATQTIVGDSISGVSYLKFVRCPMSKFHFQTYEKVYTGVLAQDAQYLMDIAFPNPVDPTVGLYRTTEIKRALAFASEDWFKKYGFKIQNDIIVGPGLDETRIGEWSAKMHRLLVDIKQDLTPHGGKILVYHDVVHVSGVLFIEQLLQHNGFIGIDQNDTAQTLCAVCGKIKSEHVDPDDVVGGASRWSVKAADVKMTAHLQQMYEAEAGIPFEGSITSCNTKAIVIGDVPVAFITVEDEDAQVVRISALVVAPEYQKQGMEEYLLEHYTPADKILTTIANLKTANWWHEHHFVAHETVGDHVYLNYEAPVGKIAQHGGSLGAVEVYRDFVAKILVPRYEMDFLSYLPVLERDGSDTTVLLINRKTKKITGHMSFNIIDADNINVFSMNLPESLDSALEMMCDKVVRGMAHRPTVWGPELGVVPEKRLTIDSRHMRRLYQPEVTGGAITKIKDHMFMPARYIMAHSDMDKSVMHKNIDRFNSIDNTWGYNCRIIVGSKIIKESYNFRSIRKVKVTARPANIATLLQIFGRSRRKKAHVLLPPEFRTIEIKIYTSCLPTKDAKGQYLLSHEETKYREKIEDYKIIQLIEKRIHENAIDGVTARNILLPGLDKHHATLGALYFEPAQPIKSFKLRDLNLGTFEIFHSGDEIRMQIYIIKRLFIETSLCFKFDQLWEAVQDPPFHVEQDTHTFQLDYFVIALSMLVHGTRDGYVRPITASSEDKTLYLLDILHSDIDKRIMQSDKTLGYVHHMDDWYIFIPFRNGDHDIYTESPFRTFDLKINKPINIMRYLKESTATLNYENQKLKFKSKYENVPLEKLATVVGKFGVSFHQNFVEELIKYCFNVWTNPVLTSKSELHEFYFKMLYYYDVMGLIVWAATSKDFIKELYKAYLLPVSDIKRSDDLDEIHSLEMSLSRSQSHESLKISKSEFTQALKQSLLVMNDRARTLKAKKKETKEIVKADPKVLPIGHFMSSVPRFYHPDKDWFESPEYVQRTQEFKENDIIVGYYEKSGTGLRVKFKIRTPIHKIQKHKDIRMIEKGSICTSNSKEYLIEIAKQLKIKVPDKINVPDLCQEIETQLQTNELQERKKKSNIKWFYAFWERRPDEKRLMTSMVSSSSR